MRNKAEVRKPSLAVRLLNILTVIMALVAVIALFRLSTEFRRGLQRDSYGGIEYSLKDEEYADMVREYYYRHYDVEPFPGPYEEAYQVAAYADAAFRRQFYQAVGDGQMAGRMQERMEEARAGSGSLAVSAGDVDQLLETVTLFP